GRGRARARGGKRRLCWSVSRWGPSSAATCPPRGSRSWVLRRSVGVLLELERHLAEREVGLQRDHDAQAVIGEPHPGIGLLGKYPAPVGNARPHDDRVPLSSRRADELPLEHLDDDRIALGTKVAVVLVLLADFERHRANPVEKRSVVERIGDGRERGVAASLAVKAGIRIDLEPPLPRLALLLGLIQKPAGVKIATSYPRFEVLMNVVPERAPVDQEHEMNRFD